MKNLIFIAIILVACNQKKANTKIRAARSLISITGTRYYVAESGSDANNGKDSLHPFKTLEKVNSLNLIGGDGILFRRGDTFFGKLIPKSSGEGNNQITYSAYGAGANPVISGFTNIDNWTNLGGNIWESTNAIFASVNEVVINGENTPMGRYPNTGFLTVNSHSTNVSITSSSITSATNWTGAEAVIRKLHWILDRNKITSQSGNTINYKPQGPDNCTDGYGFFIQNDARTLDSQNEWYYSPATKKIKVYSSSSPTDVKVASIDTLVYVNQKNYLTFDNLSFQGSNVATFQFYISSGIVIQNCSVDFSGATALMCRVTPNIQIQNNFINHSGDFGIKLDKQSINALIANNTVKNTGLLPGMGALTNYPVSRYTAIQVFTDDAVVDRNNLDSIGFMGINFLGTRILIRNNVINHYTKIIDDGGGIYCFNSGGTIFSGIKIQNNFVLNAEGAPDGTSNHQRSGEGIYLDLNVNGVEISGNTVANCAFAGIFIHSSYNLQILNNTLYNNNYVQIYFRHYYGSQISGVVMKGNILISRPQSQPVFLYSTTSNDIPILGNVDSNFYTRPINDNLIFMTDVNGSGTRINRTLEGWQLLSGLDAHSRKAPKAITDTNDLRFEYNPTTENKTVALDANYIDVKNTSYNGRITLAPFTSAVLIKNSDIVNDVMQENLLKNTEDLTKWNHSAAISILPDDHTAPDGTMSADRVTTSNGYDNLYQKLSLLPNVTYTFSFYALKGNISAANYNVQVTNTSGRSLTGKVNYAGSINTNDWTRVAVTFKTDSLTTILLHPKNDGGKPGYLWITDLQLNRGSQPANYIKQ